MKGDPPLPATLCFGDLSDIATLERILSEHRIDTVFHLAAQTEVGVGSADPIGTFDANIRGTWNILEACRRQKVSRIVIASSDKAYGRSLPPYREDMPLLPDRPYETSKACVDLLAKTYADTYQMSVATTRCVNLYGPGCMSLSTLIPNTIRRVFSGMRPIMRNGGTMRRDWLYISDAVDAYIKLAESKYIGPINFGSGVGVPVKDVISTILTLMGSTLEPIDEQDKHGEIVDQWADASLAKKILDWTPAHTLSDGLKKTVDWYTSYLVGVK
jgi:CDP-glucose 4,6-dehydratase